MKLKIINKCILDLDIIKFLIYTSWEAKIISHKQYEEINPKLVEIGRMFGGWRKNLEKKNLTR